MKNPFDYFEEIYCINLDERVDRWQHAQLEFEKVGIKDRVERVSAIKDVDGRIGLIKTNLKIVKLAKEKGLKNILIFEDDVEFIVDNPQEILQSSIEKIGKLDWVLFYLGANTHSKLIKINPNLILLKNAFATQSVAFNEKFYDIFIKKYDGMDKMGKFDDILDVYFAQQIQENYICLMVNPMMTSQMNSFSDIEQKVVNYNFIEERYKKNIK
jgi:GR25 family glycosyltransferase involved in LPS biosynthesis